MRRAVLCTRQEKLLPPCRCAAHALKTPQKLLIATNVANVGAVNADPPTMSPPMRPHGACHHEAIKFRQPAAVPVQQLIRQSTVVRPSRRSALLLAAPWLLLPPAWATEPPPAAPQAARAPSAIEQDYDRQGVAEGPSGSGGCMHK